MGGLDTRLPRYTLWPIAGSLLSAAFESIRTIGAARDGFDRFVPFAGFVAGLLIGLPAAYSWPIGKPGRAGVTLWGLWGLALGWIVLGAMRLQADEIAVTTSILAVVGSALAMASVAALASELEPGLGESGGPVRRIDRVTKSIGLSTVAVFAIGVGAEVAIGDDVDVRSGGEGATEWAVIDGGYHFDRAVELDGVVLAIATGQRLVPRWYRLDSAGWERIPDPFPRSDDERRYTASIQVWLAVHDSAIVAIDRSSGSMLRSTDATAWTDAGALPFDDHTEIDGGPMAIAVLYRDRVAVLPAGGAWSEFVGFDDLLAISVAGDDLFAQGTNGSWWTVSGGRAKPVDGPSHPAGCGGVAQSPVLVGELSVEVHVAMSPCQADQAVLVSRDGVVWTMAGSVSGPFDRPQAVVRATDIIEIDDPAVVVNGRDARVDAWVVQPDGSILVLASDPGKSTGFFCC